MKQWLPGLGLSLACIGYASADNYPSWPITLVIRSVSAVPPTSSVGSWRRECAARSIRPLWRKTLPVLAVPSGSAASIVNHRTDPPSMKWSDLKHVFWHQGGPICQGRGTSLRRLSRSCGKSMSWSRGAPVGENGRRAVKIKRAIELRHHLPRAARRCRPRCGRDA